MTSVGSVSIELKLDRSEFDAELQSLQNLNIDPIPVRLDTKGIESQLKSLKLDDLNIGARLDIEGLAKQIKDFSPPEILVRVKFDESQVQQAVEQINATIKAQIQTTVEVKQSGNQQSTGDISSAVASGLQGAFYDQLSSFNLEGKLGDTLLAPVKGLLAPLKDISRGAFENIGKGLTESLSKAMTGVVQEGLGGALDEAGKNLGGLFNLLGKKGMDALNIDSSRFKKITNPNAPTDALQQEFAAVSKQLNSVSNILGKFGINLGGISTTFDKTSAAAIALASALHQAEGAAKGTPVTAKNTPTQGFLTGDARTITTTQARGQIDAVVKELELKLAQIKQLPGVEARKASAQLAQEIAAIRKQIAADIGNQDIPESVRRSLGQLKGKKSPFARVETEVNRFSYSTNNLTGDRPTSNANKTDISLSKARQSSSTKFDLQKFQQEQKAAVENFQKIFNQVIKEAGLDSNNPNVKIPSLSFLPKMKGAGNYTASKNEIALPQNFRKRLASGQLSLDDVDTLAHELRHAMQFGFGKNQTADEAGGRSSIPLLRAENKGDKRNAQSSAKMYSQAYKQAYGKNISKEQLQAVEAIEEDAYAFAAQAAKNIYKNLKSVLKGNTSTPKTPALPAPPPPPWMMLPPPPPPPWAKKDIPPSDIGLFKVSKVQQMLPPPPPPPWANKKVQQMLPPPPPPPWANKKVQQMLPPPPPPPWVKALASAPDDEPNNDSLIERERKRLGAFASRFKFSSGRRSKSEIQLDKIKAEIQKNLEQINQIIADIQQKEIEQGIYRSRADIARSLRSGKYQNSRYDAVTDRVHQLQQKRSEIMKGRDVDTINDPLTAQRRLVAQNDPSLERARKAQKKLDDVARVVQKEIEESTGQRRRLSTVKKLLASGEVQNQEYTWASEERERARAELGRRRRAMMRAPSAPREQTGSQEYWEQQFRRLEARFYRSQMMRSVPGGERRSLASEATGFLFSGAAMANPVVAFGSLLAPLAPAIAPLAATFLGLNNVLQPLIGTIVEALRKLEPAQKRLEYVGGSKEGGAREANFALGLSNELKTPALASLEGYSKLAAAAKGTSLEGGKVKDLFIGISTASKAMQLSQEDLNLVLLGFTQIISKGKLSAEEVRQQISERLPGAFNLFAKALGKSTSEFNELLESGALLAEDVLPKVAKALTQEFGQAAKESSGSFLSALTRIDNAFLGLQKGLADTFGPVLATFASGFASIVELAAKNIKPLIQIFNVAMIGIAAQFFVGLTTIMNGSGLTAKLIAFLVPAFARVFATLTPFAVGILADFLDDIFGAEFSVMDNMMKGVYNIILSVILVIDGLIKKASELFSGFSSGAGEAQKASSGIGSVVGAIQGLLKLVPSTVIEFTALTLMLVETYTLGKMALGPMFAQLAGTMKALSIAFMDNVRSGKVFSSSLNTLTAGLANSQLVAAGATAAFLLFFAKADFSDELGSKFDKFGNVMAEAMNKVAEATENAGNKLDKFKDKIPDIKSKGFDLTLGIGEGFGLGNFRTDDVIKVNRGEDTNLLTRIAAFSPAITLASKLGFQSRTIGERQFDTTLLKNADQSSQLGAIADQSGLLNGTFSNTKAGQSFSEIQSIDLNLGAIQQQRLSFLKQPGGGSDQAIKDLDQRVKELLRQRDEAVKPIQQLRDAILDAERQTEERLKVVEESSLPPTAKNDLKNRINVDIALIAKLKQKLKELGAVDLSPLGKDFSEVRREIEKSGIAFEDNKVKRELTQAKVLANLNADYAAGKISKKELDKGVFNSDLSGLKQRRDDITQLLSQRDNQLNTLLSVPNPSKEQIEFIKNTQKEIRSKELEFAQTRIQIAQKTTEGKRLAEEQALHDFQDANNKAALIISKQEANETAAIKRRQYKGAITKEQAEFEIAKLRESSANQDIKTAKGNIAKFNAIRGELTPEVAQKQELELNRQLADANLKAIEAKLKIAEEEKYRAILERNISTRQTQATTAIKERLLAAGLTPKAQDNAALQQNKVDQQGVRDRIALIKSRVKDEKAAAAEIAPLQQQLVDLQIAGEEKRREITERNLNRIVQLEESRHRALTSQLEEQKSNLDLYNQSLERTAKLEESRFNLNKALSDAVIAPLEIKKDNASRALDLSRKLKDENLAGVRSEINSQLNALNFGTDEIKILEQRSQIENEIAAKKLEALKLEQAYQKQALELDLKRQRIAAQTAVYDAQSAQLSAAKAKLDAESAMRVAIIKKDDIGIQSAQVSLEIADREIVLGDKRLANALENLAAQDELASNAVKAQEATQEMAVDQQVAADGARKQSDSLEKVEAKAPKESEKADAKTKDKKRRVGRIGETFTTASGRTIKDGVDVTNYQYDEFLNRSQGNPPASDFDLPKRIDINQLPDLKLKPGENLFQAYQRHRESIVIPAKDKTAQMADAAKVNPTMSDRATAFGEALKIANQEVVQRLDRLIETMAVVASTPRSISISSPHPIDDAADLLGKAQRASMRAAGM